MVKIRVKGLDGAPKSLGEFKEAMKELNGADSHVRFNPADSADAERAMAEFEKFIDGKVMRYRDHALVVKIAGEMKEKFRAHVMEKVKEYRERAPIE